MTTTNVLGYFNFSRAVENSIWIAQRDVGAGSCEWDEMDADACKDTTSANTQYQI